MIRLALLRHGHTAWNRGGQIQGRTDIPLDEDARAHLSSRRLPAPWNRADLVASPLSRAMETARLVAGAPPRAEPALIEMDWGDWEGQKGAELLETPGSGYRHIEDWGWDYRPPRGESPADVLKRLEPWAASLVRDTVAVCHIGIMRVLMAKASGWDFSGPAPFRIKRDRLFVLTLNGQDWQFAEDPVRLEVVPG
jgi:broad specificity phosphatase PhoE